MMLKHIEFSINPFCFCKTVLTIFSPRLFLKPIILLVICPRTENKWSYFHEDMHHYSMISTRWRVWVRPKTHVRDLVPKYIYFHYSTLLVLSKRWNTFLMMLTFGRFSLIFLGSLWYQHQLMITLHNIQQRHVIIEKAVNPKVNSHVK